MTRAEILTEYRRIIHKSTETARTDVVCIADIQYVWDEWLDKCVDRLKGMAFDIEIPSQDITLSSATLTYAFGTAPFRIIEAELKPGSSSCWEPIDEYTGNFSSYEQGRIPDRYRFRRSGSKFQVSPMTDGTIRFWYITGATWPTFTAMTETVPGMRLQLEHGLAWYAGGYYYDCLFEGDKASYCRQKAEVYLRGLENQKGWGV